MSSDNPTPGPDRQLLAFTGRFLESRGAVLERIAPSTIETLVPPDLSEALDLPEHFQIRAGSPPTANQPTAAQDPQILTVHFGAPLLDRVIQTVCARSPVLACQLKFGYLKTQGFDKLISSQFHFHKTSGTVESTGETREHYLVFTCRYLAQSDEQKEGLVDLVFNVNSGALVPQMGPALAGAEREYSQNQPALELAQKRMDAILEGIARHAAEAVTNETSAFRDSMNRRFARDTVSLEEYYADLEAEMQKSLQRPGLSAQLIAERREKMALIPEELATKKADLLNKYGIRVHIQPATLMVVSSPVVRVLFRAAAGNRNKSLSMTYNPAVKSMEPLICQGCGASTYGIGFCNRLHLLCTQCRKKGCPACD